jgi:hypothetical protein
MLAAAALIAQRSAPYRQLLDAANDNQYYLPLSAAILHWTFPPGLDAKHFWGLPYAVAGVSRIGGLDIRASLVLVCVAGLLAAVWLASGLWGNGIALFWVASNYTILLFTAFGGSEPLFYALLFGAFACVRRNRWLLAVLLASCATAVRPVGVLAILAIQALLLFRRNWRPLILGSAIALSVAFAYLAGLRLAHFPLLANLAGYRQEDWNTGSALTFPLLGIARNLIGGARMGNPAAVAVKAVFVAGHIALLAVCARRLWRAPALLGRADLLFALSYSCFCLMYNSPAGAFSAYPRLVSPALPPLLSLAAGGDFKVPRPALAAIGIVSVLIAASSAAGAAARAAASRFVP